MNDRTELNAFSTLGLKLSKRLKFETLGGVCSPSIGIWRHFMKEERTGIFKSNENTREIIYMALKFLIYQGFTLNIPRVYFFVIKGVF